jgi:hypothetical protein
MKKKASIILFLIFLTSVAYYYDYQSIVFKRPQSIHAWRQSDCASLALNYYQNGMHFFSPETHNLTSEGGKTGKCCTSEIPILYYTVAIFYKILGYHEPIFRLFNMILFFLGLFYLFRLFHYLLKDVFWAISLTLLFFTSPVLVFYGNNFLSNSSALAFSFIGWYYFIRFLNESKSKWFYISMAVFFVAGAFKVTALFSLFAITGALLIETVGITKFNGTDKQFKYPLQYLLVIISVFLLIGSWIVYAHIFNQKHDCTYFSTTIFPIWNLDKAGINGVLHNIREIWLFQYFHLSVFIFLLICSLYILISLRRGNKLLNLILLLIFVEIIAYIMLQFWTFRNHDYYVIDVFIFPFLIVVSAFDNLKRNNYRIFSSFITKFIFTIFLIFNVYYAHQQLQERYNSWMNNYNQVKDIYTITPYLRQIGISPNDTIISIPDESNVTLYLMNQKGWTEYTDARLNMGEKIRYNQDSAGIAVSINHGAKYLILNGVKELYFKPYLQYFCTNLAGSYNHVLIFNLKDQTRNFNLEERNVISDYKCNAEFVTQDKTAFQGKPDSLLFGNGETQSSEFAYSGKYSSKLDSKLPYGMTFKILNIKINESFKISVWRKSSKGNSCGIIASSTSPNEFYLNQYSIIDKGKDGWEKLAVEFFITNEFTNKELAIYLYNPDQKPAWFDDLEIIRFESIFK